MPQPKGQWVTTSISCFWAWPLRLTLNLVFQLEFLTAFNALSFLIPRNPLVLFVWISDKMGAVKVLNKLSSFDTFVDGLCLNLYMMCQAFGCKIKAFHTPSDLCIADPLTRLDIQAGSGCILCQRGNPTVSYQATNRPGHGPCTIAHGVGDFFNGLGPVLPKAVMDRSPWQSPAKASPWASSPHRPCYCRARPPGNF